MSDVLDRYRILADDFDRRVAGAAGAWDRQSPCDEWTAGDVVAHVVGVHRHFLCGLDGTEEPTDEPDDVAAAWADARVDLEAALADPDRSTRAVESPFGHMPFEQLVGRLLSVDLLVHTWDLARATGGDEAINEEFSGFALSGLRPLDGQFRGPGMFKPAIDPPAGADNRTQLLSFLGRQV
ncbi:MAG: TIGR03086 family metal-binding protein [Acidimicrobiia bacterium]